MEKLIIEHEQIDKMQLYKIGKLIQSGWVCGTMQGIYWYLEGQK